MHVALRGLGALIMLSVCGLSAFFVVADRRHGQDAAAAELPPAVSTVLTRGIDSRGTDPDPLTVGEVFGRSTITMVPGTSPYVLRMTHLDNQCPSATTGELGDLLQRYGCSQVIRATLLAPLEGYVVTVGVFNLPRVGVARFISGKVKTLVDTGRGRFAGMAVDRRTRPVALPSAQVAWQVRGHFLSYCVIARPDGRTVRDDDPFARHIVFDLVESYLSDDVLGRRALAPA